MINITDTRITQIARILQAAVSRAISDIRVSVNVYNVQTSSQNPGSTNSTAFGYRFLFRYF